MRILFAYLCPKMFVVVCIRDIKKEMMDLKTERNGSVYSVEKSTTASLY